MAEKLKATPYQDGFEIFRLSSFTSLIFENVPRVGGTSESNLSDQIGHDQFARCTDRSTNRLPGRRRVAAVDGSSLELGRST